MFKKIIIFGFIFTFLLSSTLFAQTIIKDDFRVNDDYDVGGSNQKHPTIAMDNNGNFVVVWVDERNSGLDIYGQRFDRSGNPVGENFRINDSQGEGRYIGFHLDIAMNASGDFVVVWQDRRNKKYDIYAQIYDSHGSPIGYNFKVNDDYTFSLQFGPTVAMNPSGEFVVVWVGHRNTEPVSIYGQRYSSVGDTIDGNFKIVSIEKNGSFGTIVPAVAINPKGEFVVTWTAEIYHTDTNWSHREIHTIRVSAKNEIMEPELKVNDSDSLSSPNNPDIAIDAPGNFVITWLEKRAGIRDIYAQRYNFKGETLGSNFRVNEQSEQPYKEPRSPKITMNLSKGFVIGWLDSRDITKSIYLQYYNQLGEPEGSNVKVIDTEYNHPFFIDLTQTPSGYIALTWDVLDCSYNADIFTAILNQRGNIVKEKIKTSKDVGSSSQKVPAIAAAGGKFLVSWNDLRYCERDIYAQRFNSTGDFLASNFKVNQVNLKAYYSENSSVSMDSLGNFVVAFLSSTGSPEIYIQRYDFGGQTLGENIRVNDNPLANQPDVAMDPAGNLGVVWTQVTETRQYQIFAQLYDHEGNKIDSNFLVSNFIDSTKYSQYPKVAKCDNGNFLVTWRNTYKGGGSRSEIWGQLYDSSGNRIGDNFMISDSTVSLSNYYPDVGMDKDGNFVVAWYGAGNILIQKFNADGSKNGSIIKALDSDAKVKEFSLAVKSNGEFLVTWTDYRNGNPDIYAQRFDAEGNPLGGNFKVNSYNGENYQTSPVVAADDKNYYFAWVDNRGPGSGNDIYSKIISFEPLFVSDPELTNLPETPLLQNYPNPFNPITSIQFYLEAQGFNSSEPVHTTLFIYNILGQKVRKLVDEDIIPGNHQVMWDGKNDKGQDVGSGIYFYVLKANDIIETRKMSLIR